MTAYRRARIEGATYFFTVCLAARGAATLVEHVDVLRRAYVQTQSERPFLSVAAVVLPDHLHTIWTLPEGDADFSTRWGAIKARFSRDVTGMGLKPIRRSRSKAAKGDAGVWQRRFWEHVIRDERDLSLHIRYCWGNPVRHGLVERAVDWPHSSIHRDIRAGRVEPEWADMVTVDGFGE
ncbi:REP-associated tyrosine transposase [Psychromarinibacter sp. S121]|uniref:REP-associated tyrosine transposase n=1 Tax=Psychromarinibacter sp. S121 TaxID=3415127 RepID=UPI003C7A27ED